MLPDLSDHVDPFRLCDQGRSYEGRLPLAGLARLAQALAVAEGEATYRIRCDRDQRRRARIRGSVDAVLTVVCQRCMGPMRLPVHGAFQLAVVKGETEADSLPDDYDALLLEGDTLQLASVIEDELLLALPVAPLHPPEECGVDPGKWAAEDTEPDAASERDNPFAVLAGLKPPSKDV
jgi:uncharacterized protein